MILWYANKCCRVLVVNINIISVSLLFLFSEFVFRLSINWVKNEYEYNMGILVRTDAGCAGCWVWDFRGNTHGNKN